MTKTHSWREILKDKKCHCGEPAYFIDDVYENTFLCEFDTQERIHSLTEALQEIGKFNQAKKAGWLAKMCPSSMSFLGPIITRKFSYIKKADDD